MAHNLEYNELTKKHSFFSVKQPAWHGLGQVVSDYPTSREAIAFAGLNYEVVKAPLFAKTAEAGLILPYPPVRHDAHRYHAVSGVVARITNRAECRCLRFL